MGGVPVYLGYRPYLYNQRGREKRREDFKGREWAITGFVGGFNPIGVGEIIVIHEMDLSWFIIQYDSYLNAKYLSYD
jgi:hypothetical protein